MKRLIALLTMAAMLLTLPVMGLAKTRGNEPLHTVNLDQSDSPNFAADNYFEARWIVVTATIAGPAKVEVRVLLEENGSVAYDQIFNEVNGPFTTPEIFLEYQKSATVPYRVELYVNDVLTKSVVIHRMLLKLRNNTYTTRGIRFREYEPSLTDEWMMFTPIDFDTISANNGSQIIDLIGSNMYIIGKLTILRSGDRFMLTIQNIDEYNATHPQPEPTPDPNADPNAPVIEDHGFSFGKYKIAMYPTMADITSVDYDQMPAEYEYDTWYSLSGNLHSNPKQILYVNGRVSYDPNGLERMTDSINSANTQPLLDLLATFPVGTPQP